MAKPKTESGEASEKQKVSASTALELASEREVAFIPFGAREEIKLSVNMVRAFIAVPTASGALPSERDCLKFVMLCKARQLNPFEGDAFLVGYDSQRHGPQFSLLTAHQAFLKRAEASPEYDGMESGICVRSDEGEYVERQGDMMFDGDRLIGGWARVHFKTRSIPMFKRVRFEVYDTGYSRWKADPGGMICKVSEADALRSSFPTLLGGMYIEQELQKVRRDETGEEPDRVENTMMRETKKRTEDLMRTAQDAGKVVDAEIVSDDEKTAPAGANEQSGASESAETSTTTSQKAGGKTQTGKAASKKRAATKTAPSNDATKKDAPADSTVAESKPPPADESKKTAPAVDDFPPFTGDAQANTLAEQMPEKDIRMAKSIAAGIEGFDIETAVFARYNSVYLDELNKPAGVDLLAWLKHLAKGGAS